MYRSGVRTLKQSIKGGKTVKKALFYTGFSILVFFILILTSCATNPVTGKKEFVLMTESQEIAMGEEADGQIIAMYGLYPDTQIQAYVNDIGQDMAAQSHRPHLQWHFRVLDTPVVNAFAVPGGYIYVTRGLMAHLNSEAELAGVIGHEIGHVTARHSVNQYTKQILIIGGIAIGMAVSKTFRKYAPIALVGVQLLFLKFSRDQERQADDLGVLYSFRIGYNPSEFSKFFLTLNRMKETRGGGGLPGWLSTHPVTELRYRDVQVEAQRVVTANPPSGQLIVRSNEYLQHLDGMVYGEDPRQGYAEGNAFYHPDLRFQFNYPTGWNLQNTNSYVLLQPSSEDAFIQLTLTQTAVDPRQVFNSKVSENNLTVVQSNWQRVNGLDAFHGICDYVDEDENTVRLRVSCIRKEAYIYTFLSAAEQKDFNQYHGYFSNTINSFQVLRNSQALNRQPARLSVRTVTQSEQAQRYIVDNGVPQQFQTDALLINARRGEEMLPRNSLFKLIR
jgi:predicted Zn-dependent protease